MPDITQLHRAAMELADEAAANRRHGHNEQALDLTRKAFELERAAAREVESELEFEPTRSVLHRSAASLALECDETREAERLIGRALSGNPPDEIAEELRDLLEDVYFRRHLSLRGIVLQPDEFQLSLEGNAVGFGIAPTNYFLPRIRDVETLIFRTAERKRGRRFRESGRRPKELSDKLELYVSVPRAASFAVSFRIGGPQLELDLPGASFPREVITDVFDCIDLLNAGNLQELEERIPDESYYRNFVGLAEQIAPDGEGLKHVGFTVANGQGERHVVLAPRQKRTRGTATVLKLPEPDENVEVEGTLLEANAKSTEQGGIEVVDDQGKTHKFTVPRGMMSDIVKPLFEERVVVTARRKGRRLMFESITVANTP